VAAVVRFDPELGTSFPSFAVPTITGELKRHLRDRTWDLKVPRSAKEASLKVARATEELELTLGRRPTAEELRDETGLDQAQVADARAASQAHSVGSIDVGDGLDHPAVAAEDPRFEVLIDLTSSRPVIQGLPPGSGSCSTCATARTSPRPRSPSGWA